MVYYKDIRPFLCKSVIYFIEVIVPSWNLYDQKFIDNILEQKKVSDKKEIYDMIKTIEANLTHTSLNQFLQWPIEEWKNYP